MAMDLLQTKYLILFHHQKILALNAQVNAANIGFHTLKKYKK